MKCPFCQGVIDDDSRYCDLCGKHLMFCPECRQPKKGLPALAAASCLSAPKNSLAQK